MGDQPDKFDPFKPAQPRIPGVSDAPAAPPQEPAAERPAPRGRIPPAWIAAGAAGAVVFGVLLAWLFLRPSPPKAREPATSTVRGAAEPAAAAATGSAAVAAEVPPIYPDEVATTEELEKPWAWKRFTFMKAIAQGPVPAILVRLPGGSSRNAASYWAFSLRSRYGKCEMELVTDLNRLRDDFGYRAQHPMVVEPCTNTVFDPLRHARVSGALVRGEIAQGAALRPPLMIDVELRGNRILAVQME